MMDVVSTRKNVRQSARKLRFVAALLRGMTKPEDMLTRLRFVPKKAAEPIAKTIQTAIADAEKTFKLKKESLKVRSIVINEGPTLKRWRPVSRGTAHAIRKRTAHIKVVLEG